MARAGTEAHVDRAMEVGRSWYVAPKPTIAGSWLVYSLDFVLATLQGCVAEPHRVRRTPAWTLVGSTILAMDETISKQ